MKPLIENVYLKDQFGNPSLMVRIPKFKWSDVWPGAGDDICSAFIVGGREVSCIYISKYLNCIKDGIALSLPERAPAVCLTIDEARAACKKKGPGWHLMSNAEWVAVALWYEQYGKSAEASDQLALLPETFGEHGRIWEFVAGLRLQRGQLQVIPDNDSALNVDESGNSKMWRAVDLSGNLISGDQEEAVYFDGMQEGNARTEINEIDGGFCINTRVAKPQYPDADCMGDYACSYTLQRQQIPGANHGKLIERLRKAGILWDGETGNNSVMYVRNYGERIAIRGGNKKIAESAGPFALYLSHTRELRSRTNGFRAAYVDVND